MPSENREAHDAFCNELIDSLNPETPMKKQLAQSIAEDSWRLNRACAIENNIFAPGHGRERRELQTALADAQTFLDHSEAFNRLSIYEQRINSNLQRNMKLLNDLQAERKAQHNHALEEAKLLAQVNLMSGLPYEPERNGFVFSHAEINRGIDRDNRLKAARQAAIAPRNQPALAA